MIMIEASMESPVWWLTAPLSLPLFVILIMFFSGVVIGGAIVFLDFKTNSRLSFKFIGKVIFYVLPIIGTVAFIITLIMGSYSLLLLSLYLTIPIFYTVVLYYYYSKHMLAMAGGQAMEDGGLKKGSIVGQVVTTLPDSQVPVAQKAAPGTANTLRYIYGKFKGILPVGLLLIVLGAQTALAVLLLNNVLLAFGIAIGLTSAEFFGVMALASRSVSHKQSPRANEAPGK